MSELLIACVSGSIGIIGAVVGSLITGGIHRSHTRKERLLTMHAEFNSSVMTAARSRAETILPVLFMIEPGAGRREILSRYPDHYDAYTGYWEVLNFYRRLAVLSETENIDMKLSATLFGDLFTWWYMTAYCHHLRGTGWYLETQIHELWRFFALRSAPPPEKFHVWVKAGQASFEEQAKAGADPQLARRLDYLRNSKPQWLAQWRSQRGYEL